MKAFRQLLGTFMIMLTAISLQGAQVQFKILNQASDLPEIVTEAWEKGDLYADFGDYVVIFGGSARSSLSYTNYPVGDTKGYRAKRYFRKGHEKEVHGPHQVGLKMEDTQPEFEQEQE